jgi:cysteine-S-conjugate beta-lyase
VNADESHRKLGSQSRLIHAGRLSSDGAAVNPVIERASTYLYDTVGAMRSVEAARGATKQPRAYGRRGTVTTFALEDALTELEQGHGTRILASGLGANVLVFQAALKTGDHVIVSDGVYGPVRRYVTMVLKRSGIAHDFCRADGEGMEALLRPNTRLIYFEVPGSSLFEVVDLPRLATLAHQAGAVLAVDNTWASGWLYHPLALGADISVLSATKYLNGHSDVLLGAVITNERVWSSVNEMAELTGAAVSPDDCYQVLRGVRTLPVRMKEHAGQARALIDWFQKQPFVQRVYYPGLSDHPGYSVWQRDFKGANGLFSIELRADIGDAAACRFIDALQLFGIGSSWGGYESLVRLESAKTLRSVVGAPTGPVIRIHAGLEDVGDLLDDLHSASKELGG